LPPLWAGIIAPAIVLLLISILPFLDRRGPGRAVWFARERCKPQVLLAAIAVVLIILSIREAWR
jgi:H+/Cl- antiporter ClcA